MATAKQKAWRKRFGQLYGKRKGTRKASPSGRGNAMGKKKGGFGKGRGNGGFMKPALYGTIGSLLFGPLLGGAVGGYLGSKNVKGAAIGVGAGLIIPAILFGSTQSTGIDALDNLASSVTSKVTGIMGKTGGATSLY